MKDGFEMVVSGPNAYLLDRHFTFVLFQNKKGNRSYICDTVYCASSNYCLLKSYVCTGHKYHEKSLVDRL